MKRVGQIFREGLMSRVKDNVQKRSSVFILHYSNISSPKISDLRKTLKSTGAQMYISKNNIARLALKELKYDRLADKMNGQLAFIWIDADVVQVSKALVKFVKDLEMVTLDGGLLEGRLLEKGDIQQLSDLPSKHVLLTQLVTQMQSPLTRLAMALNGKTRELLSVLNQLKERSK